MVRVMELGTAYGLNEWWAGQLADKGALMGAVFGVVAAAAIVAGYWGGKSASELQMRSVDPTLAESRAHDVKDGVALELWPRGGLWYPFVVLVPIAERDKLKDVTSGPPGHPPDVAMVLGEESIEAPGYAGIQIQDPISRDRPAYVTFSSRPSVVVYGQRDAGLDQLVP
jgi:hypothetical protein